MIRATMACLAISSVALLTACGGGGGGDATPATSFASIKSRPDVFENVARTGPTLLRQAARQSPQKGSVTQSLSLRSGGGVAFDGANTSFDGRTLTLNIERAHGASITLRQRPSDTIPFFTPFAGDIARHGTYWGVTGRSGAAAYTVVNWDNVDPSNYLAGGYWIYTAPESVGVGAFVDGPELGGAGPSPTLGGTARYAGSAAGLYGAIHGSDTGAPAGSTELGEFAANIGLVADFNSETIGGCIACDGSMELSYVFVNSATGQSVRNVASVPARIVLPNTSYDSDGWISGRIFVQDPRFTITDTHGEWGGEFSTIPNSDGEPRAVAGTVGGYVTTAGGGWASFVGAWYGANP